jgi:hypothetical protein
MYREMSVVDRVRGVNISRRRLLGGVAALATGLIAPNSVALAGSQPSRVRLTLPAPTGPHDIGTVSLHLVDHARQDPWWSTPHPRELMISLWYPAKPASRGHLAPWMPPAALASYRTAEEDRLKEVARRLGLGELEISLDGVDYPLTHARQAVPVQRSVRPYPVVLYSPGYPADRETGTVLVEDLASRGYVVVTVGHTYDAPEVEFPGRRVELGRPGLDNDGHLQVAVRRADTLLVLDRLAALAAGEKPEAGSGSLPASLSGCLDLTRIGMFGHSFGGATTGQSMAGDDRIIAGIDLDGHVIPDVPFGPGSGKTPEEVDALVGEVATKIGTRPFMIMSSNGKGPTELGGLMTAFWYNLPGWRRFLSLIGSTHGSYTDSEPLYPQLAAAGVVPRAITDELLGPTDPNRAVAAQRAYVGAFFDLWLRSRDTHLLDGQSAQYPEIKFF